MRPALVPASRVRLWPSTSVRTGLVADIPDRRKASAGAFAVGAEADGSRHESAIEVAAVRTSHDSEEPGMHTTTIVGLDI